MIPEKSQYKSLTEWRRAHPDKYAKARREGWLDEICQTFGWKLPVKLSKKVCMTEAKKHTKRSYWQGPSRRYAVKHGFYEECIGHMDPIYKPFDCTLAECINDAKNYTSLNEWQKKSRKYWGVSRRKGWNSECRKYFNTSGSAWTKEQCIEDASKHYTSTQWKKRSSYAYGRAKRCGWLDECCKHLIYGHW